MTIEPEPNSLCVAHGLARDVQGADWSARPAPRDVIFDPIDDRRPVEDPSRLPYKDIALVHACDSNGRLCNVGTAFYFAPGVAVSAAHVVQHKEAFRHTSNFRADYLQLWFGYSHGRASGAFVETRKFVVHPTYDVTTEKGTDVVVILLPPSYENPTREPRLTGTARVPQLYKLAGFPAGGPAGGRTMTEGASEVVAVVGDRLMHQIDATRGQSGSPVWWRDEAGVRVAAIHNEGTSASYDAGFLANGAALLTPELSTWIAAQNTTGND